MNTLPSPSVAPVFDDAFIEARARAILEARERKQMPGYDRTWWIVGAVMFALGFADGMAWWYIAMIPGFHPLPRLLP